MIFFTFMTVRRHCRSRSAADCTFTIIHAEEWNLIWSISGWAPPMDCKKSKRYNELDAGTREVNGEINPNAQTESDKTSFFYYNISDFLVFYIYIYSYIFIYMLILQLRRKIWNKCWFNIRVCKKKKKKCFLLPHWHKCLKIFLKRPAKGQRSTQRSRRHCCMSYDSTAGKRKMITTMLHRNPVHIYLFFIFLRMNKHIKTGMCTEPGVFFFCSDQYPSCVRQQSCASTNSAYRELLQCLQRNHVSAESHWTSCHQASPADTWFPPRQQVPQFQFQSFFFFLFFPSLYFTLA